MRDDGRPVSAWKWPHSSSRVPGSGAVISTTEAAGWCTSSTSTGRDAAVCSIRAPSCSSVSGRSSVRSWLNGTLCSGSSSPRTRSPATSTVLPSSTTIPSARCWASVTSESWLPLETTSGTSAAAAMPASRRMQVFSTAVPLTVSSPELSTTRGRVAWASRVISSVIAWLQCRSLKPSSIVSPGWGCGSRSSCPIRSSTAVSM